MNDLHDYEASILGGIFLRNEVLGPLDLHPLDFTDPRHRAVFESMRRLEFDQWPIDPVSVEADMRQAGTFDACGGLPFIAGLTLHVPSAANVHAYAARVREGRP